MSLTIVGSPTRAPAFWVADERTDRDDTSAPSSSAAWALLEALAHVGALIDPSGVLAGQCFRRTREPERRPASLVHAGVTIPIGFATVRDPFPGAVVPEGIIAVVMAARSWGFLALIWRVNEVRSRSWS